MNIDIHYERGDRYESVDSTTPCADGHKAWDTVRVKESTQFCARVLVAVKSLRPNHQKHRGNRTKVIIELECGDTENHTAEEIKSDLRMGESQIGWYYDYKIKSIEVTD